MLFAFMGPILLFVMMYAGFAAFRYKAQGKRFRFIIWLERHLSRGRGQ